MAAGGRMASFAAVVPPVDAASLAARAEIAECLAVEASGWQARGRQT